MKVRPTDDRVILPMTREFCPEDVTWTHRPTHYEFAADDRGGHPERRISGHWEINLGWVTLEMTDEEMVAWTDRAIHAREVARREMVKR